MTASTKRCRFHRGRCVAQPDLGRAAGAKRRLGSRALEADVFQTTACWWLSLTVLAGVGLNARVGWWWADPVAALGMCYFLVREGS